MNGISYLNWQIMNDVAIEKAIGRFVKSVRQQQNKTQSEVADAARISRSTLSLLERGETVTLATLIQVLRVLNQLHVFSLFEAKDQASPLALAKIDKMKRQRVRKKGQSSSAPKTDW